MTGEVTAQAGVHGAGAEHHPTRLRLGQQVEPQRLHDEGQRVRPAAVVAEVEQVVAGHAVVLEVARAVVVRRPAEHHRAAEVVGGGVPEVRADDGGDPGPGALGAPQVLDVVAPDEELRARQPDPVDQVAGDQHAVERDHHPGDQPGDGRGLDLRHPVHHAGASGQPDREAEPSGVLLGEHGRAPEVEVLALEQDREAVAVGDAVVVHQPGQVGTALHRPAQALVEPPGAAAVLGQRAVHDALGGQPLPGAVGGGVVDHQDLVDLGHLAQPGDQALQQRHPVEGHHHGHDAHAPHPRGRRSGQPR